MWNSKAELIKKAKAIADKKHPCGYGKKQLIECSKEVYGGFGETQTKTPLITKRITTHEDINNMGNAMANIDGHYPVGMSGCFVVGINGQCGPGCPVYLDGDCEAPGEMVDRLETETEHDTHIDLYGQVWEV